MIELKVPDIGDFKDVEVIEVLVKPGDLVAADQSLITIESDKASMEIPSSVAGVVRELKVKVGDKINQGDGDRDGRTATMRPRTLRRPRHGRRPRTRPSRRRCRRRPTAAPEARAVARAPAPSAELASSAAGRQPVEVRRCRTSATSRTSRLSNCWSRSATRSSARTVVAHDRKRQGVDGDPGVARPGSWPALNCRVKVGDRINTRRP